MKQSLDEVLGKGRLSLLLMYSYCNIRTVVFTIFTTTFCSDFGRIWFPKQYARKANWDLEKIVKRENRFDFHDKCICMLSHT